MGDALENARKFLQYDNDDMRLAETVIEALVAEVELLNITVRCLRGDGCAIASGDVTKDGCGVCPMCAKYARDRAEAAELRLGKVTEERDAAIAAGNDYAARYTAVMERTASLLRDQEAQMQEEIDYLASEASRVCRALPTAMEITVIRYALSHAEMNKYEMLRGLDAIERIEALSSKPVPEQPKLSTKQRINNLRTARDGVFRGDTQTDGTGTSAGGAGMARGVHDRWRCCPTCASTYSGPECPMCRVNPRRNGTGKAGR